MPAAAATTSIRALAANIQEDLWFGDSDPNRCTKAASASLAAQVAWSVGLKPFPAVAARVLQLVRDPEVNVRLMSETIETDPGLAAQLLRVANSALYRPPQPYVSIEQAVMRLGLNAVVELVAGVATMGLFRDSGAALHIRDHCAGVAAIARTLATECRFRGVGHVFLAGLLHDIGKLFVLQSGELDESMQLTSSHDESHLFERIHLGYDHAVLGAHVLAQWELPNVLCKAVAWHHQPGRAYTMGGEVAGVVAYLRMADLIEHAIRTEMSPEEAAERAAACEATAFVDVSYEVLMAMWPKLIEARKDLLAALT